MAQETYLVIVKQGAGRLFDLRRPADRERVRALVARFEAEAARMLEFNPDA